MIQSKHAYLIIAHANPYVLEKLLQLLDDERNDIYVHVDSKSQILDFERLKGIPKKSNIYFTERIDVRWGNVSQIETELLLFETASHAEDYFYYHLISGADLPIRSQNYIHAFFLQNAGTEFIGFSDDKLDEERVNKIHLFSKYLRLNESDTSKRLARKIRLKFLSLQRIIGYNRAKRNNGKFVYGSNWVSVTSDFVKDLLQQKEWFLDYYKYSNCGDEIFKHTFAYNSVYKDRIYDTENEMRGCLRFMDWKRGRPYTFRADDIYEILNSGLIFARKFEDNVDTDIVDKIYQRVSAEF